MDRDLALGVGLRRCASGGRQPRLPRALVRAAGGDDGGAAPAALVTPLGGAWLVLSPWVLGYAGDHTAWLNELVTGALLSVLAASCAGLSGALRIGRSRRPATPSYTS